MPPRHGRFLRAALALKRGQIIAYPTEAVYGLGCDPFDPDAVGRLRQLKQRPPGKGLLLIASDLDQVHPLIGAIGDDRWQAVLDSWPGPVTWVFPASPAAPPWLCADNDSIAIRLTRHPLARQLCQAFHGPIVSTSANHRGGPPARSALTVRRRFGATLAAIVSGPLGGNEQPSTILRASDGTCLRA